MSGLVKQKYINFEDSNIALFGSDVEKKLKQSAAETEKAWQGAGLSVGVRVWRIEKFKVIPWPDNQKGQFYRGDAYIVLNTYKRPEVNPDKLYHEIFFWIGSEATQDEYGTAAYKTVELDDHLHGDAPQHREIDGSESHAFLDLFKVFRVMDGGIDTGFHHVGPIEYKTRLLHMRGTLRGGVVVRDVELSAKSLNSSDVFLLDTGLNLFHFVGKYSNPSERLKAQSITTDIQNERGGHQPKVFWIQEEDTDDVSKEFWKLIGGRKPIARKVPDPPPYKAKMYHITDSNWFWSLSIDEVPLSKDSLNHGDVFMIDKGNQLYVWIGSGANSNERSKGVQFGTQWIYKNNHPNKTLTISRIIDGHENADFWTAFK